VENKKHKTIFVKPKVNRIELDPVTVIDPNPLPKYTYGSASRETFPQTFPFVRKRIDDLLEKEGAGGVGVAGDVSTPTFGGSEGEGKEIDFFKTKGKIIDIINKYKIYLKPGEKPPEGKDVRTGSRDGKFYESTSRESTLEEASPKDKLKMNIIANKFKQFGFRLFEVGGSIRDELLGKSSSDRDFSTDALPEETEKILNSLGSGSVFTIGKEYGTIGLDSGDDKKIEITTFRDEVYPTSSRKPKVTFGKSLEKDLSRRDFTINAMARNTLTGELIDLFGGGEDLKNKIIRTVGNSKERYAEDPLRMLRAVRFASQLGFKVKTEMPEPEKLDNISRERVTSEFTKILTSKDPIRGLELLDKFGLMEYIIPDVNEMKDVSQNVYHKYDVYDHTMETVKEANKTNWKGVDKAVIMLAALLHDIGKPETKTGTNLEDIHFYGHQKVSTEKAKNILKDLKFNNTIIKRVAKLVELHMEPMMNLKEPEDITEKRVSKLIRKIGNDKDALILMDLVGTDNNASANPRPDIFNKLKEKTIEVINTQKPNEIVSPISGKEIMDTFGLKAGRAIGSIKDYLTGKVVEGELNEGDKETANKLVISLLNENPELTKSFILNSIKKARIYLTRGHEELPSGKTLMFGPRGGRYYESELEVYRHLWAQVKERQFKEKRITEVINYLENRNLPSSPWWIKVEKDGIIVGQAEKVQTVLKHDMYPQGLELTRDE
jgi:poly(A) polymerase